MITDILGRLDSHDEYAGASDTRQLHKDAAEHIRCLNAELWSAKREIDSLRAVLLDAKKREIKNAVHADLQKMSGRAA